MNQVRGNDNYQNGFLKLMQSEKSWELQSQIQNMPQALVDSFRRGGVDESTSWKKIY